MPDEKRSNKEDEFVEFYLYFEKPCTVFQKYATIHSRVQAPVPAEAKSKIERGTLK